MEKIVTKKEMVSNTVDYIQKEIDRILSNKKGFFNGETIEMHFYNEKLEKFIKNNAVENELIKRYKKAGWNISLSFGEKNKEDYLIVSLK